MNEGDISATGAMALPIGVREALLRGRWYMQRPDAPGFLALDGGPGTGPVVPVFSSQAQLARYAGACAFFTALGDDLIGLLPEGHGLVVDIAGPDPQHLPAEALDALRADLAGEDGE